MTTTLNSTPRIQPSLNAFCPVQSLNRVKFTPFDTTGLKPVIEGTVFDTQDTSGGNWRIRIVKKGESFPFGLNCCVYSHEGTFEVIGQLDPNKLPAIA